MPIFADGLRAINEDLAFRREDGHVVYFHGLLPIFQHDERDMKSFRMFTSQLIANGTVRQRDIVEAFGAPLGTVKRYLKVHRERGAAGLFQVPRRRWDGVLTIEVRQRAQSLFAQGKSVPELSREIGVRGNTIHKAIRAGRLHAAKKITAEVSSSKSERSETDSLAPMGYGATRTLERVAAPVRGLESAPVIFEAARDIPQGGVLLAIPAL